MNNTATAAAPAATMETLVGFTGGFVITDRASNEVVLEVNADEIGTFGEVISGNDNSAMKANPKTTKLAELISDVVSDQKSFSVICDNPATAFALFDKVAEAVGMFGECGIITRDVAYNSFHWAVPSEGLPSIDMPAMYQVASFPLQIQASLDAQVASATKH